MRTRNPECIPIENIHKDEEGEVTLMVQRDTFVEFNAFVNAKGKALQPCEQAGSEVAGAPAKDLSEYYINASEEEALELVTEFHALPVNA